MVAEGGAAQNARSRRNYTCNVRIAISFIAIAVAGLALGVLSAQLPQPTRQLVDSERIVLVARADAELPPEARSLAAARIAGSIEALDGAVNADTSLVVVDRSVAAEAENGSLRGLYLRGMALMAINVSLADLYRLTGQDEELRAVDPQFAAETIARASCEGECARDTFWSLTWRSCSGDKGGASMGPFVEGHTSAREFDTQVARQVALGPPCSAN
jgi:hypothetical protein